MCFLPGHDHTWKECPNNHKSKNFCGTDHRLIEQGLKKCSVPEHEHRWKDCPYNPKSEHYCGIYKSNELDELESSEISDEDSEASEDSESSSTTRSADGCKLESEDSDGVGSDVEYESEISETSDEEASEYSESSSTTSSSNGCKPESEDSDEDSNDVSHEDKVMSCSKEAMDRELNEHIVNLWFWKTCCQSQLEASILRMSFLETRASMYADLHIHQLKWLCALEREGHLKLKRGRRGVILIVDFRNLVNIIS